MRRVLASLALGVGLLAGSFAWWGFTLERTVSDPGRADDVVDVLLDQQGVQDGLVDGTVAAMRRALPPEVVLALPADQVEAAARSALASPEAQEALRAALLGVHGYVTGTMETSPTLSAGPVDQAVRQQLSTLRPELAPSIAAMPPLSVTLPDQGIEAARSSRAVLADLVRWAAIVSCAALAVALVVSPRRAGVLRKMGWWAVVTGGVWVALRFAVPPVADALLPAGSALVGGLAAAVSESMLWPGLILVAVGVLLILGGSLVGRAAHRERSSPAALRRQDPRWSSHARQPAPARAPAGARAAPRSAPDPTAVWAAPSPVVLPGSPASPRPGPPFPPSVAGEPTTVVPVAPGPVPAAPRWVEGRGYVTEDATVVDQG